MSFNGGDINDDGSFKVRKRTKKMETLRTCFRTETNVVVPAGDETFYLRIVNPNGETLSANDSGSGELVDVVSGEAVRYTMSGELTYNFISLQSKNKLIIILLYSKPICLYDRYSLERIRFL